MNAVEETIFSEPIDEIMLSVPTHGMSTWLHQGLRERMAHFGLPITVVCQEAGGLRHHATSPETPRVRR